jgi:uncharacterized protein YndB with AHSA1/START domain
MPHPTTITAEPGLPFIDIRREFDAPPEAVFRAHTDPSLYAQWLGPRDMQLDRLDLDARPGGQWRYDFHGHGEHAGMTFSFFGVFHTVQPNTLLVQTFEFNLAPGQVGLTSTRLEEVDGRTRLAVHEVYPSLEARDAALASGMESGIREGYERLDEFLAR